MHSRPLASAAALAALLAALTAADASAMVPIDVRAQAITRADQAVDASPALSRVAAGDQFTPGDVLADANGTTHVHLARTHRGLTVFGGDVVVHTAPGGLTSAITAAQTAPIAIGTTPSITAAAAQAAAKTAFKGTVASVGTPTLIVDAAEGAPALAYETRIKGQQPNGEAGDLHVIVDAKTGKVRGSWTSVLNAVGTGNSFYSGQVSINTKAEPGQFRALDGPHGSSIVCDLQHHPKDYCPAVALDPDNIWGNGSNSDPYTAVVDASYGIAKTYDMLQSYFGRPGVYLDGTGVQALVHQGAVGYFANAQWNPDEGTVWIGDTNDGLRPVAELDVLGHELGHGVVTESGVLTPVSSSEPFALNEAAGDIFGTLTEFYANNPADTPDYTIGEKINLFGDGKPIRYMYKPSLNNGSDCYSTTMPLGDPHLAAGPADKFFYMLAEGSTSSYGTAPRCNSAPAVTGIGRIPAGKIWYRAVTTYFTTTTKYQTAGTNDARAATLSAAKDLYGLCSTQYKAVQAAWKAAAVAGEDAVCA